MRKYLIVLITLVLFFSCKNVLAIEECTSNEFNRLKELANNINFSAEINYETVKDMEIVEEKFVSAFYDVKVLNSTPELKIYYEMNGYKYEVEDNYIETLESGKIKFYIYAYTANLCVDELIMTKTLELEELNSYYYYNKEKCQQYSDFKYCQEFYNNDLSFEEIEKEFDDYLKENNPDSSFSNSSNYILYIFVTIIFIILVIVILFFVKRKRKDVGDL